MLNNLNPEQVEQLAIYRDKWIKIGISTSEINVLESLKSIKQIYENSNLTFPEKHEVYDSPFAAIVAMKKDYGLTINPNNFIFASHESSWLSFYSYFIEVCDLQNCENVIPMFELAKHCGWCLLFDEMVVLTRKPSKILWDNENRTHCEDGLAIEYCDGTGVAIWHGQRIPSEWVKDKSSITPDVFLHWNNIEQRRCACEIIGWAEVLKALNSRVVNEDNDPTVGTLLEVNLPDLGSEKFLLALDPNTNKQVGLPVPPEMTTALEANSWTYGIDKFEFVPDFRV